MKRMSLVILIATFMISWQVSKAQSAAPLTAADHKNYIVSIDQKTVKKTIPVNASIYPHKIFSKVIVKVSNNSNDTLKYLTMSCGWDINFRTDNTEFKVAAMPCQHNVVSVKVIPPHKNVFFTIAVAYNKTSIANDTRIKIGMIIIKYNRQLFDIMRQDYDIKQYAANMIWSNPVQISNVK